MATAYLLALARARQGRPATPDTKLPKSQRMGGTGRTRGTWAVRHPAGRRCTAKCDRNRNLNLNRNHGSAGAPAHCQPGKMALGSCRCGRRLGFGLLRC